MEKRDITMDDMKDMLHMKVDFLGALCAVVGRAKEIHENEALPETQPLVDHKAKTLKRRRDESVPKPKPKRRKRRPPLPLLAGNPPLPEEFQAAIEEMALVKNGAATEAKLVIQKKLYHTDLSSGHNRLSIPFNDIENDFLTEEEKQYLLGQDEKKKKLFFEVKIVQPSLEVDTVKLCRWDMPKKSGKTSSTYVIRGSWNAIVKSNKLRFNRTVQLWGFRVDRELCFALVKVPRNRAA
ncbi:hypothetical protein SASPL_139306 [Salvia splendens]|uniref:TF-B3 domain-containing protein n=1 Tax=Salvia splendens TaxID=180675 RepID=A0A8X8ZAJ4_SALSN|nr:B3 domain-containing protein At3g25182-like [Salvia splendens]KAG6397856.1 hypothetical protein SASPL_139306 [Salvia splendens]